ncbi:hypothetical protein SDC9_181090 [bioreactor metagenome]|uniref:RagB/SusD domain-containing protein n=1 Tax=bioreactor metagenome TaxID=1076179 RepID=A0A645H3I9_9ZZZZ
MRLFLPVAEQRKAQHGKNIQVKEEPQVPPAMGKNPFREIIQQERSIELAFEEHRFWDVRRWGLSTQEFNGPVQGWYYQGEDDAEFYRVTTVDDVIFTNRDIFWPIRNYDISVNPNLLQNLGW